MLRRFQSVRGIVLVASASVAAVALSACTPPMPPDVLAAQAEQNFTCYTSAQEATAPGWMSSVIDALNTGVMGLCPQQGVTAAAESTVAPFALTGAAPTDTEQKAFTTAACPSGKVIYGPAFAYGVGLAVNGPGMETVVLSPKAVAGILAGTITSWSDPAIAQGNEGLDLSSMGDITLVSLKEPDASVSAMTAYLTKADPTSWTSGTTGTLSTGTQVATTDDLVTELTNTPGAVGVLPTSVALGASLAVPALAVDGQAMDPTNGQQLAIGAGATTLTVDANGNIAASPALGGVPNPDTFDAAAAKIVLPSGEKMIGWPVNGYAHMLACTGSTDYLPASTFLYTVTLSGQGAIAGTGNTPLPEPVRIKVRTLAVQSNPSPSAVPSGAGTASPAAATDSAPSGAGPSDAGSPAAS